MIETVTTPSFQMDYFKFGQGSRIFVILPGLSIKSVMLSEKAIKDAYSGFAEKFTVYVFDRRKNLPDVYTVADMARDTAEAAKTLGLERFSVFGASQGGMIAQYIAIEYPELVEKLILGSTASRIQPGDETTPTGWSNYAAAGNKKELVSSFAEKCYSEEFLKKFGAAFKLMHLTITKEEMARFKILSGGMSNLSTYEKLPQIQCPVLIIGSMKDKILPPQASIEMAEKLKSAGKDCTLYMYEGYSHAVYDEAPDYKDRLLEFLA